MVILAAIFIILDLIDKRFDSVDANLIDIANRIGLRVDYIEDGSEGKSYEKSSELIENAKFSLITVGYWEPFPHYAANENTINVSESKVINARRKYYSSIKKQIEQHRNDDSPFHRRIIQVPEEFINQYIPFEVDPVFKDYLLFIANFKNGGSRSCILRKSKSYIKLDFTLIDDQYIILPVLTSIKNQLQSRYGAIIINDTEGLLTRRLKSIYWDLENRAKPIELDELEASN